MRFSDFTVHQIEGYISSIFLLEYPDEMLLIDSGSLCDVELIEKYCKSIDRTPSEIRLIVVSHMHPDHSGGACVLRNRYHIPLAAFKDVDRWYAGIGGFAQYCSDCFMAHIVARRKHRNFLPVWSERKIKADYLLNDGDHLPFFYDWKVVHVPGHTLHDIALHHEKESLLYVGDCVCEVQNKASLPLPVLFPQKMKSSFDRMTLLQPTTILRAHGTMLQTDDPTDLFARLQKDLDRPRTRFEKRIRRLSVFSWEVIKEYIVNKSCN